MKLLNIPVPNVNIRPIKTFPHSLHKPSQGYVLPKVSYKVIFISNKLITQSTMPHFHWGEYIWLCKDFLQVSFSHKIKSMSCLLCVFKFMLKSLLKMHIKTNHNLKFVLLNTLYVPYICFNATSKSMVKWGLTVTSAITKQSQILILIIMSV